MLGSRSPAQRLRTALMFGVVFNAIAAVILLFAGVRAARTAPAQPAAA
jgi:hypothetical protein